MDNAELDKSACRARLSGLRNGLDEHLRTEWSVMACKHMAHWLDAHSCRSVMAYVSFRSELNMNGLIEWCWRKGIEVFIPRCVQADRSMTLHVITAWDQLTAGSYGILEPEPDQAPAIPPGTVPDVVIVPGLAFDRTGGRLGYGGGYYDRFADAMSGFGHHPLWIGAGFEAQVVEQVPSDSHDLRLDGLVTERELLIL